VQTVTHFLLCNFPRFEIIRLAKETDAFLIPIVSNDPAKGGATVNGGASIQKFPAGQFILINCNVPMFKSVSVDEVTEAERVSAGSFPVWGRR
jgi:hypothetical protein